MNVRSNSVEPEEIEKFERIAEQWWDAEGEFRPLHKFNPIRLGFIRDCVSTHFDRNERPLAELAVLDIGCGGGLVCEPLARLGAKITGIDASERNIGVAKAHAGAGGLVIDYQATTAESLADARPEAFDLVLILEIVEHVRDVNVFVADAARLLRPGGLLIAATLNRTLKSLMLAKIGAEYVLRWVPKGSHDYDKFVTPEELAASMRSAGLTPGAPKGVTYQPLRDQWRLSEDTAVNYMLAAEKSAS